MVQLILTTVYDNNLVKTEVNSKIIGKISNTWKFLNIKSLQKQNKKNVLKTTYETGDCRK